MDRNEDNRSVAQSPLTLPFNLTSRDWYAIAAYERDCVIASIEPNDKGRAAWVLEWRSLDEETSLDAIDFYNGPSAP